MATTAITIESQVANLQLDIKTSLEAFFANLPEMENNISMGEALIRQSSEVHVGRLDADDANYRAACEIAPVLKHIEEEIEGLMKPFIEKLYQAHRTATGIRKTYLDPLQTETKRLKGERESYAAEQERQRREAAQKAQQEACDREQARLIEEARQAAAAGDSVTAEAILEEAVHVEVAPVILPSATPAIAGTSFRSVWDWTMKDKTKLKPEFIIADEVAIGKIVRSMHQGAQTICGAGAIVVTERKVVVDR